MKFLILLILPLFVTVALAVPNPSSASSSYSADTSCFQQSCLSLSIEYTKCHTAYADETISNSSNEQYLRCLCSGTARNYYDKCIGCDTNPKTRSQYTTNYESACRGYKGEQTDNQTDNQTHKGGAATSDKTCMWSMLGFVVTGGLVAVM